MSEGSPVVTFNQLDTGRKPGSVGTPVWGVQVKLVDADGNEIAVKFENYDQRKYCNERLF